MRTISIVLALCSLVGCDRADSAGEATGAAPGPRSRPGAPAAPVAPTAPLRLVATETPIASETTAPPFTLTASDGSGLELVRVDARAVVEGPLAFTELHLDFHNPEDRPREGTFAITLSPGASVSRFAMAQGDRWQEAEVVARPLARRAYDDFLHRRQDPALLEKAAGNQFSAKVFPIPARSDKHLIVSFSQELAGRPYALPLRGLPKVAQVDVTLDAAQADGTRRRQTLSQRAWQPDRDFVAPAASDPSAVTADTLVVAAVPFTGAGKAGGALTAADVPHQLILAVDTSASRALGFAGYVGSVRRLVTALRARPGEPLELQVIAFDQDTQPIFDGLAADYGDAQDRALLARGAAGASNLAALIDVLGRSPKTAHRRLAIVSDGVMTAGPDAAGLVAAVAKLPVDRVDVVLAGGIRDPELAAALVRAGRHRAGDVLDLDDGAATVAAGLGESVAVDVAVAIPGATWVYPTRLPSVRPGKTVMIHARMAKPSKTIDVVLGGQKQTVALAAATPALVGRAVAAGELDELERRLAATTDRAAALRLRDDITARSVRARVLSSQTSMLVLETEDDYARYGIDRSMLGDLLVVGPTGLEASRPVATAIAAAPPAPAAAGTKAATPPPAATAQADPATERDADGAAAHYPLALRPGLDDAEPDADLPADGESPPPADTADPDQARLARVLGDSDLSAGLDDEVGGSATGEAVVSAAGGGGGAGWGTIGLGRSGTIGHGSATGDGAGYGLGSGRGGLHGRSASAPTVRIAQPTVVGELDRTVLRRYLRRQLPLLQVCYNRGLAATPTLAGTVATRFTILPTGRVTAVTATGLTPEVAACIVTALQGLEFPRPPGGAVVQVAYPLAFAPTGGGADRADDDSADPGPPALTGQLADVMAAIAAGDPARALTLARSWHDQAPGDVLALIGLGEAEEAGHDLTSAARSYGSIIDLFPARADLRRFAGERLERLGTSAGARGLAVDTYRRAVADRPDHLTGHRLLAYALFRQGDLAGAFAAILVGVDQPIGDGRYAGADQILDEDAGMIAAAYLAAGGPRAHILAELGQRHLAVATAPSTRFVLYWETDANDVDLHVRDRNGDHAWYSNKELPSGGALYADVTTGYGPECFTIPGTPTAGPYRLSADYYSRGPMGYGMGLLQIERFDGTKLTFDDRPFVIMNDHAMVELGST